MRKAFVIIGAFALLAVHGLAAPAAASAGVGSSLSVANGVTGALELVATKKTKKARKKAPGGQAPKATTPPQSPPASTYH